MNNYNFHFVHKLFPVKDYFTVAHVCLAMLVKQPSSFSVMNILHQVKYQYVRPWSKWRKHTILSELILGIFTQPSNDFANFLVTEMVTWLI